MFMTLQKHFFLFYFAEKGCQKKVSHWELFFAFSAPALEENTANFWPSDFFVATELPDLNLLNLLFERKTSRPSCLKKCLCDICQTNIKQDLFGKRRHHLLHSVMNKVDTNVCQNMLVLYPIAIPRASLFISDCFLYSEIYSVMI